MLDTEIINLSKLSKKADVPYFQIYRRQSGDTKRPLSPTFKTKLFNAMWKEVKALAKDLGFEVTFSRKEDPKEG